MHCKSLWIKASAKCINVNVIDPEMPGGYRSAVHTDSTHSMMPQHLAMFSHVFLSFFLSFFLSVIYLYFIENCKMEKRRKDNLLLVNSRYGRNGNLAVLHRADPPYTQSTQAA